MASKKRHPYLTVEFWKKNRYWDNDLHTNHEYYIESFKRIIDGFTVKEDKITK